MDPRGRPGPEPGEGSSGDPVPRTWAPGSSGLEECICSLCNTADAAAQTVEIILSFKPFFPLGLNQLIVAPMSSDHHSAFFLGRRRGTMRLCWDEIRSVRENN